MYRLEIGRKMAGHVIKPILEVIRQTEKLFASILVPEVAAKKYIRKIISPQQLQIMMFKKWLKTGSQKHMKCE